MTAIELRALRLKLGLTQKELGEIMGLRRQEVSRLETGRRSLTLQQAAFMRHIGDFRHTDGGMKCRS